MSDEVVGGLVQALAGVLDEQAARGQRGDPQVLPVVAAEEAAREALLHLVALADALLHRIDGLVLAQRHEQRILALVDLGAQPVAHRFEILLRHIEPFVPVEEGPYVPDVVRGQRDDVPRQRAQLLGQQLGIPLVGGLVGGLYADQQQGQVANAVLRSGESDHAGILARQQLVKRRAKRQAGRQDGRSDPDAGGYGQDQGRPAANPGVIATRVAVG